MIVPGSNLLNLAMGVIGAQAAVWYRATGRTQNDMGQYVTSYADPIIVRGSMQPLDKPKYEALGLDMARVHWVFYTSHPIEGVSRGESPDYLEYNGRRLEVVDEANWFVADGWRGLILVDEGPAA